MSETTKNRNTISVQRKVVIMLQDHNAVGKVYAKLNGDLAPQEMLIEAMKRVESGPVYADKACKKPVPDDFIEVQQEQPAKKGEERFVFLIDRQEAQRYIIGAMIVDA